MDAPVTARARILAMLRDHSGLVTLLSVCAAGLLYYATFVYAHPLTVATKLDQYVGKRVTFQGRFGCSSKEHETIHLDQTMLRFSFAYGSRDWSPKDGETVTVVGTLQAWNHWNQQNPEYVFQILDGECYPVNDVRE